MVGEKKWRPCFISNLNNQNRLLIGRNKLPTRLKLPIEICQLTEL